MLLGLEPVATEQDPTSEANHEGHRAAIQKLCDQVEFPSDRSQNPWGDPQLTLRPETARPGAWVCGTNEVPDQSYRVMIWDHFTSFPTAPHMTIRALRLSPETTRVQVLSEAPVQSSSLVTQRRIEHEQETLRRISDILAVQWLSRPKI